MNRWHVLAGLVMLLAATVAARGEDAVLREPLDRVPADAPKDTEIERVDGRLDGRGALRLARGSLGWSLDEPVREGFVELWLKPAAWDAASADRSVTLMRLVLGEDTVVLRKPAGAPHLELSDEDDVHAVYPIYNWMDQPWQERTPEARWHYVNIGLQAGQLRLTIDGHPARPAQEDGNWPDGLGRVELSGAPGTDFAELHVVAGAPLSDEGLRERYRSLYRGRPNLDQPTVTVPMLRSPPDDEAGAPAVDGVLGAEEWQRAARIGNFVSLRQDSGALLAKPISASLLYDEHHLYLALRTPYEGELASRDWGARDARIYRDEAYEIFLMPPWTGTPRYVQLIGNPHGNQTDLELMNVGWNGQWRWRASRGEGVWDAELRAAFAGLDAPSPANGAVWSMNILNTRADAGWSFARRYHDEGSFGVLRFEAAAPIIRTSQIDAAGPRIELPVEVIGNGDARELTATLEVYGPDDVLPAITRRHRVSIEAWQRTSFTLSADRGGLEAGVIAFAVDDGDDRLHYQTVRFPAAPPVVREGLPEQSDAATPEQAEAADEAAPEEAAALTPEEQAYAQRWPSEQLGEALLESEQWRGNDIGLTDTVPAPWTAMRVDGQTVRCWGRSYEYDDSILPAQVISDGEPLLADRPRFVLERDGQRFVFDSAQVEIAQPNETRVVVQSEAQAGPYALRLEATYEYDGMARVALSLDSPEGVETVDGLHLALPLRAARSELFHVSAAVTGHPPGTDSGTVPAEGLQLDFFRELVWLGDDRRGLCWFAEDLEGWHLQDEEAIETVSLAADGARVFRVKLADRRFELAEAWETEFGFQATPTRPQPERYRALADRAAVSWNWFWGDGAYYLWQSHVEAAREQVEAARAQGREVMPTSSLRFYGNYRFARSRFGEVPRPGMIPREVMLWGPLWQMSATTPGLPRIPEKHTAPGQWYGKKYKPHGLMSFCPASPFQDYYLHRFQALVEQTGLGAVYLDQPLPRCGNAHHGCGYIDYQGQWRPRAPIFAARRMLKRLRQVMHEAHGEAMIRWHSSNQIIVPVISFADIFWDGENYAHSALKVYEFYSKALTEPRMRVQHTGRQFGFAPHLLPEYERRYAPSPASVRDMVGLFMVHDSGVWPTHTAHNALVRFLQQRWLAQEPHGLDQVYYWQRNPHVHVEPETVRYLLHHGPERGVLVLFNWSDRTQRAPVKLDLAGLGMTAGQGPVRDALTGAVVAEAAEAFSVEILPRDFRLLTIGAARSGEAE